jgi:hypothetical protein
MSSLPRVGGLTRERIAREFDDRGPEVCRIETTLDLEASNPELLDVATRCARDVGDFARIMTGFCMFYRVLAAEARGTAGAVGSLGDRSNLYLLPRVSRDTRANIVKHVVAVGSAEFTREVLGELERNNPELLQMWHHFAEDQADYIGVMQGFALLYACLLAEAAEERGALH